MAVPTDNSQFVDTEDSTNRNVQGPSLKEYLKAYSTSRNDCNWLYEFVSSDAISAGAISPKYLVRVYYRETEAASTTTTQDFGIGSSALLNLQKILASKNIRAVTLCYRESSQVDPDVLDLLWAHFKLEVSFMRHHFDYKGFRDEAGCPRVIRNHLEEDYGTTEDYWTFAGRWNPIQLPSETRASKLRLSVDSECLSVCCRGGVEIVIALVRSKAMYQEPLSSLVRRKRHTYPCAVDLFAATATMSSIDPAFPSDPSDFSCGIVHLYARLLVLRCYEDYSLRHDTQPINVDETDRIASSEHSHIIAMHHRRLELVKLKQDLFAFLGPTAPEHKPFVVREHSGSADDRYRGKLRSLLTDIEMLLSLYDNTMRIYDWHIHETDSNYKNELANEQLEEAKESKATAMSLNKLSQLPFLYLPINFVCSMLGMNLSVFGQGEVPIWVFFTLVAFFGLLTYMPIYLPSIDRRRVYICRLAYHLSRRSVSAGFWFLAFSLAHSYLQNFEIMNSGLTQIFLGYKGSKTKGWMDGRNDGLFKEATLGSEAFWKEKVKKILGSVEELASNSETTGLNV